MNQLNYLPILRTRQTCRICGSRALTPVLSLGEQYISGCFSDGEGTPPVTRKIPLELVRCDPAHDENGCGLVQLKHSVPPPILYHSYWYRSGINQTMTDHLKSITEAASFAADLRKGDLAVDIGCNDGTLLKHYRKGTTLIGFEPSASMCKVARDAKLKVVNDFFSAGSFSQCNLGMKPKVITSIAMFYDLENPHRFVADIKEILDEAGVWVLEMSYLPTMLAKNSYDTICHEHLEYYSLAPLERLLATHGLVVVDVKLNDINGGSFQVFVKHIGNVPSPGAEERIHALRLKEFQAGLDTAQPYVDFYRNIHANREELMVFLKRAKKEGKRVHGYGASTKGNTILQYCGVTPELVPMIADRNPAKWGSKTIGTNIQIVSEDESRAMAPDYYLVLPWHFMDEFKQREKAFLKRGGMFVCPLPELTFIGNKFRGGEG